MAEPRAQDLRRLGALEERLAKASAARSDLTAARRELRARLTESERRVRAGERAVADLEKRVSALLAENAALAARLDDVAGDAETLRRAAEEASAKVDGLAKELEQARAAGAKAEQQAAAVSTERDRLAERVTVAEEQLRAQKTEPLLPPAQVAVLLDGFVGELGGRLPGMVLRDGEVKLQVAFGAAGKASGFVVPTAETASQLRGSLHEVSVRFERGVDLPEQG